jgi:hypothetical protein
MSGECQIRTDGRLARTIFPLEPDAFRVFSASPAV